MNQKISIFALALLAFVVPSCSGSSPNQGGTTVVAQEVVCGDDRCDDGETVRACPQDCFDIEWVAFEPGSYTMGFDEGLQNERPAHEVTLAGFEIMQREVTDDEYRQCVNAGECTEPVFDPRNDMVSVPYCTWLHEDREDHPINCIDWEQARSFCQWIDARLPTEAEWEYAARGGGRDVTFPWGNAPPSCTFAVMGVEPHHVGCREERTFPVCSKPRGHTPQGLCDMAGSVMEWVEDAGHESYEGAPTDGTAWVDSETPETRVARGGSLSTWAPEYLRTVTRFLLNPDLPRYVVGIRCAR